MDYKKKTEIIADTLGQKVVGIESAKCDKYEEPKFEERELCLGEASVRTSLETLLFPDTISVDKSMDVIWIIE